MAAARKATVASAPRTKAIAKPTTRLTRGLRNVEPRPRPKPEVRPGSRYGLVSQLKLWPGQEIEPRFRRVRGLHVVRRRRFGRAGLGRVGLGRVGLGRVGLGRVGLGRLGRVVPGRLPSGRRCGTEDGVDQVYLFAGMSRSLTLVGRVPCSSQSMSGCSLAARWCASRTIHPISTIASQAPFENASTAFARPCP